MELPFTVDQFLDGFARFNAALWPLVALSWLMTAATTLAVARAPGAATSRAAAALLVLLWAAGTVYHALYFTAINPAAWGFAGLFAGQTALLGHAAWRGRLHPGTARSSQRMLGLGFVLYGLAYPLITWGLGHTYPRMPVFAVPCPTTLVTAGVLLTCAAAPRRLVVIPVVWGVIGGSAAIQLGVTSDAALFAAAAALVVTSMRRRHGVDAPRAAA